MQLLLLSEHRAGELSLAFFWVSNLDLITGSLREKSQGAQRLWEEGFSFFQGKTSQRCRNIFWVYFRLK